MATTLRLADGLASATFLFILALWICKFRARRSLDLPPGPKRLPLLGNLLDMPTASEWETYHRWCKELDSDIIHLDVAGTSIIVLDSAEAATDLLEKRPMIYSSRPRCVMINELMGWERNFGFMKYCEQWRIQRRLFDRMFNRTASRNYQSQEARTTRGLLKKLLKDPDNLFSHLRYHASTIILSIAYGIEVLPEDDPHVAIAEEGVRAVISAARPGAFLVESLPFLKYVPSWMPGAGWKRQAKEWYRVTKSMADMPFETAKARIAQGTIFPSFTLFCHQQYQESRDPAYHEDLVKDVAVAMFSAGSDTTVSLLETFFLAMLANPEAQKKAQEEIDRVVKTGHLPDFLDQESLPFVTAILKETFRWQKILPNGVPHCLDADDVYKGYRIPAGSIIIANSWAMLHDETIYPDPFTFKPERFLTPDGKLDPNVTDPALFVFGFGKRICPGRHMAYASAWSVISSILTVFNIEKATNSDGSVVEPTYEYGSALVSHPAPFKCTIKPRSIEAEKLIRELDLFDNMGSARA